MREAKTHVSDCESRRRDAEPQYAVPEDRALQLDQAPALLVRRPQMRKVGQDEMDADRIEQLRQILSPLKKQEHADDEGHEEEEDASEVARHRPAGPSRQ